MPEQNKQKLILPPPDIVFIKDLDVNLIKPNPNNPMVMGEKISHLLIENIKRGGFITAVTVWKPKGSEYYQMIDGEHRWRAVMALGHKTILALYARHIQTQSQADYFLLMLNRIKGHFEQNKLGLIVADLDKNLEHLAELTGYNPDLIDAMTRLIDVPRELDSEEMSKAMERMGSEVSQVVDPETLSPSHPFYDEKPVSLFMVSLQTQDFLELSKYVEKIREAENIQELATILLKVFKNYVNKLQKD